MPAVNTTYKKMQGITKSRAKKCTSAQKVSNLERELFNDLLKWKDAANRKPLIIKLMGKQHTLTSKARNR